MKLVIRIKDSISAWLYNKLVSDPPADCPFSDTCREVYFEELESEIDCPQPMPWSDLD